MRISKYANDVIAKEPRSGDCSNPLTSKSSLFHPKGSQSDGVSFELLVRSLHYDR
jgi:hypothetical protein